VSERGDLELYEAWGRGDKGAGAELYERWFHALYRFFRNKADDATGDLIQQTFLACLEARERFRGESGFGTFLFSIARHQLFEHWRRRRRDQAEDIAELSLEALTTTPSGVVARNREHALLLRALRAIPLDLQIALELHYWEELSGPQLAEVLGIPEGTVRSRLRRAREALQEKLATMGAEPDVVTSTLGDLDKWAQSLRACLE
jgi:RNA polymerase sigma-70 factor (ECF subfamily)